MKGERPWPKTRSNCASIYVTQEVTLPFTGKEKRFFLGGRRTERKRIQESARLAISRTPHVSSWSSVIEIVPPDAINSTLDGVAVWMVSQESEVRGQWDQTVVPVDKLQIAEVGSPAETFCGEMAAAHLG